ncbi:hypothetical protein [Brucella pseudogrignonensis]|uniref:hypothetical protein n=1 Tax=Brucella pseudogrignonensis TaxID=419475 RepID=UPI003D99787C
MLRRTFLLGATALLGDVIGSSAADYSAELPFPTDGLLRQFKDDFINRTYPSCAPRPVIKDQVFKSRLNAEIASRGYSHFLTNVLETAEKDFQNKSIAIVDGWILPEIEVELLIK